VAKTRGYFLTFLIWLQGGYLIQDLLNLGIVPSINTTKYHIPSWYSTLIYPHFVQAKILFFILDLVFLWGIWYFKKWAVYGFFIVDLLRYLMLGTFMFFVLPISEAIAGFALVMLLYLIFDGIWLWAILRKWSVFEGYSKKKTKYNFSKLKKIYFEAVILFLMIFVLSIFAVASQQQKSDVSQKNYGTINPGDNTRLNFLK